MAGIRNIADTEREKYFSRVSHDCGPVTSYIHASSGSDRHTIPLRIDNWVAMYQEIFFIMCHNTISHSLWQQETLKY